jgi:hypothetical protein
MDRLPTKAEVAEHLRIPVKTLSFWRSQGKGPQGKRIGTHVFYRESDVEAWINSQFAGEVPRESERTKCQQNPRRSTSGVRPGSESLTSKTRKTERPGSS